MAFISFVLGMCFFALSVAVLILFILCLGDYVRHRFGAFMAEQEHKARMRKLELQRLEREARE